MIKSLLAQLTAFAVFSASTFAAVPCDTGSPVGLYDEHRSIQYGADAQTDLLDLFTPTAARLAAIGLTQAGVTLLIHGAGARYNDSRMTSICEHLATNGIACASVEFPQPDGVTTFIWDGYTSINCALRWLRAHGGQFGYATRRIGVYGDSLGGMEAMWQVATQAMTRTPILHKSVIEPNCPDAGTAAGVDAAVIQYGLSDLTLEPQFEIGLLGSEADNPVYQREFSPITYLDHGIPQLVSVGDYDTTVTPVNTGQWVRRLIALGAKDIYVDPANRALCSIGAICGGPFTGLQQYWDLGGFGHGYQIFSVSPNRPNNLVVPTAYSCAVVAFLLKALLPAAPSVSAVTASAPLSSDLP